MSRASRISHVIGARPNFMKAAPTYAALARLHLPQRLIHTGQHYDRSMSDVFFKELSIPVPDINLEVGSASHAAQTAQIMTRLEGEFVESRPDLVLVYGDVNSTLAAALVCAKLNIPFGHVEAGLRSFDRTMPEEVNRVVTDQLAELLFTPSQDGDDNLLREGVDAARIHRVGNVMIDTLVRHLPMAESGGYGSSQGLKKGGYVLVTMHRPSNVDDSAILRGLLDSLFAIARGCPVVFPVHPRTRARIEGLAIEQTDQTRIRFIEPVGYLDFLNLQLNAAAVITDSGGIQEETTYLGIPCMTVRENTERPTTVTVGTNMLVGADIARLKDEVGRALRGGWKKGAIPPLWDGGAGERIAKIVAEWLMDRR
ncbi:MAG: UDP-N-acetylglucosamine 2-epimerase (non-hydrolyzing) [Pseudomonadota bacterium]